MDAHPALWTTGTPMGCWAGWAQRWLQSAAPADRLILEPGATPHPTPSHDADAWGVLDPDGAGSLRAAAAAHPHARFLLLVERPEVGLAAALLNAQAPDPDAWLVRWCEGARALLTHIQNQPQRCLVLDVQEARAHTLAVPQACADQLRLSLPAPSPDTDAQDPLAHALACALVSSQGQAPALYRELVATTEPLSAAEADPLQELLPPLDARGAAHRLTGLLDALAHAQSDAEAAHTRSRSLQLQLDALQSQTVRLQAQLNDSQDENALLLTQLLQSQETLDAHIQGRQQADAQLAQAQAAAESAVERAHQHQQALQSELSLAQTALQSAQSEATGARDELRRSREEADLLLSQLHQVQEELETQFLARQDLQTQLNSAFTVQAGTQGELQQAQAALQSAQSEATGARDELRRSREEADLLLVQLHQVQEELETQFLAHREAQAQQDSLQALATQLQKDLQAARQEGDRLLIQLDQTQEAFRAECLSRQETQARLTRAQREAAAASAAARVLGWPDLGAATLTVQLERDTPPHRELSLQLQGLPGTERASIRLVEHHGHPGLIVFGPEPGSVGEQLQGLLRAWQQTGEEDRRPFMRLVPTDEACKPLLDALPRADWALLQALSLRLPAALAEGDLRLPPAWAEIARRLRIQLLELPPRLRWDSLQATHVPPEGAPDALGTLALRFTSVDWGVRQWPLLTVHWHPQGAMAGLDLLADADHGPPLPSWPDDAARPAPDRLRFGLGTGQGADARHQPWAPLSPADRAFVLAVFQALPAVAAGLPPELQRLAPAHSALHDLARELLDQARRAQHPPLPAPAPRSRWQRLLRRGEPAPHRPATAPLDA